MEPFTHYLCSLNEKGEGSSIKIDGFVANSISGVAGLISEPHPLPSTQNAFFNDVTMTF